LLIVLIDPAENANLVEFFTWCEEGHIMDILIRAGVISGHMVRALPTRVYSSRGRAQPVADFNAHRYIALCAVDAADVESVRVIAQSLEQRAFAGDNSDARATALATFHTSWLVPICDEIRVGEGPGIA
jgi:hypothetical protein